MLDGTRIVTCDTSPGLYRWNASTQSWDHILRRDNTPAGTMANCYSAEIAPSNTSRFWARVSPGRVYRSDDKGDHWANTAISGLSDAGNLDVQRVRGPYLAVDPGNPDVCAVGDKNGLRITRDGGTSYTAAHPDVPASTTNQDLIVAFDPSSATVSGKKQGILVGSFGHGLYRSNDGGASFALIAGSPTDIHRLAVSPSGVVYVTCDGTDNAKKIVGSTITTLPTGSTNQLWHDIAINPANQAHVVLVAESGAINQSFNTGASFMGVHSTARVAADVPWLAWTNEDYMSAGAITFDPARTNTLLFAEGIGFWEAVLPATLTAFDWTSKTRGIENLISQKLIYPPGGYPILLAWDRPVFTLTDLSNYPTTHGPNRLRNIVCGWDGDFAGDNPSFVAGIFNWFGVGYEQSGFSLDKGLTFAPFPTTPPPVTDQAAPKIGGSMAVSTTQNIVWVPSGQSVPYYTPNRGQNWYVSTITGGDPGGWHQNYFLRRFMVAAVKGIPGRFLAYSSGDVNGNGAGLFRSDDGGATFARIYTGQIVSFSNSNVQLLPVPGRNSDLFFTGGDGSPAPKRSTDGGFSWTALSGWSGALAIGFGAPAVTGGYPSILIVGVLDGVYGIFRSIDNAASFQKLGDYPLNMMDQVVGVAGSPDLYGRVFVLFAGSTAVYGDFA